MRNDHRLGFPVSYERGADPVYPLGVPVRLREHLRDSAVAAFACVNAAIAFETGDHTPPEMRAKLAIGDVVTAGARWVQSFGRRAKVVAVSASGETIKLHFHGDAAPDPGLYVAFAFERVTQ